MFEICSFAFNPLGEIMMKFRSAFLKSISLIAFFMYAIFSSVQLKAEEYKPVLAITISGFDDVVDTVGKLVEADPQAAQGFAMAKMFLAMIDGVDKKTPFGVVMFSNGTEESIDELLSVSILPIPDLEKLRFGLFDEMIREAVKSGKTDTPGVYEIDVPNTGEKMRLEQKNGYLIGGPESAAGIIPEKPTDLLEKLSPGDLVSLKWYPSNTPKKVLESLIESAQELSVLTGDENAKSQIEVLQGVLREVSEEFESILITIGLPESEDIKIVCDLHTIPGTKTSKDIEFYQTAKSNFGGFFRSEKSIFSAIKVLKVSENEMETILLAAEERYKGILEQLEDEELDPADLAVAKNLVKNFYEFIVGSMEQKEIDMAFSVDAYPTVIMGISVDKGGQLLDALRETLEAAKKNPNFSSIDFDSIVKLEYAEFENYKLSKIVIPHELIPAVTGNALEEESINIHFAISEKAIALGIGTDSTIEETLKKAISDSEQPFPVPVRFVVLSGEELCKLLGKTYGFDENIKGHFDGLGPDSNISISAEYGNDSSKTTILISLELVRALTAFGQELRSGVINNGGPEGDFQLDDPDVEDFEW